MAYGFFLAFSPCVVVFMVIGCEILFCNVCFLLSLVPRFTVPFLLPLIGFTHFFLLLLDLSVSSY